MTLSFSCIKILEERLLPTSVSVELCYIHHFFREWNSVPKKDQKQDGECIWEYEILGLWSTGISY